MPDPARPRESPRPPGKTANAEAAPDPSDRPDAPSCRASAEFFVDHGHGAGFHSVNNFKHAYLLEFLALPSEHSEADLHQSLLRNPGRFLTEFGRDARKPHENPAIGLLLCASKDSEVVEYALNRTLSPALIAEYQAQLPDKKLLAAKLHEFYALNAPEQATTKPAKKASQQALDRARKEMNGGGIWRNPGPSASSADQDLDQPFDEHFVPRMNMPCFRRSGTVTCGTPP